MNEEQIELVQSSFEKVVPIKEAAAEIFYNNLFETAPEVKPYFKETDIKEQGKKLMATIGTVVNGLKKLDDIVPVAEQLAIRHVDYGVKADDYDKVGASLLYTLEKGLGDDFTDEVKQAWSEAYGILSDVMKKAAYAEAPKAAVKVPFWKFWARKSQAV